MQKIPLFKKADLDASVGVFFDGFSKVIVGIAILAGTLGLSASVLFGTLMPGVVVGVVLLNGGLWYYYRAVAKKRGDANLTAVPAGLQAGRLFIWLFSIMLPVYTATNDALLAFKVGVLAHFIGGLVFVIGAFVVPKIVKIVPAAALFGALAGGAMAFLVLQSMDGILKMPIVGWVALVTLLVIYLAKINVKLPAALIAIIAGSAVAWLTGNMSFDAVTESFTNVGFYLPKLTLDIFSSEVLSTVVSFLPIIIVFSIGEVITGIQAVEQAVESGDTHFTATKPLVIAGVASMVSALFGNPFALGLYWGYPGWKKIGAGTGYHLGCTAIYAIVGLTGLTAIINAFLPEAAVLPILVFVGAASFSQAFEIVDKKYYPAVALAFAPILMEFIRSNVAPETFVGFEAFRYGSTFIAMIFGSMLVFIIDKAWNKAGFAVLCGIPLLLVGMIHSPGVVFTETYKLDTNFLIIYSVTAIAFFVLHFIKLGHKDKTDEDIVVKTKAVNAE